MQAAPDLAASAATLWWHIAPGQRHKRLMKWCCMYGVAWHSQAGTHRHQAAGVGVSVRAGGGIAGAGQEAEECRDLHCSRVGGPAGWRSNAANVARVATQCSKHDGVALRGGGFAIAQTGKDSN